MADRRLFDTSLKRDLGRSFVATLVVLLTIVLTLMLIRTLGLAAGAKLAPQDVVLMLGYTALANVSTLLAGSLFIAQTATKAKPETSPDWKLAVKRGRDGRDK